MRRFPRNARTAAWLRKWFEYYSSYGSRARIIVAKTGGIVRRGL